MSSYLSDLEHKRIEARVHRDRVTESYFISDIRKGIRRKVEKKTWKVKEVIGRGSFGQVRLEVCEDGENTTRERAVKKITLDLAVAGNRGDKDTLKARKYENELKALLEFSKPKYKEMSVFVEFLGWFEDGFDLFIAMEYLRHGDLEKNLPASGKLPEAEVKVITKQILDGLHIMHLESFAHRDLKPQNVLVVQGSPNWWIKLADFGLTKRLTESTHFNTHAGTLAYMAPEMLDRGGNNSDYTHAVDLWALGCIVFRLLTGSVPFPSAWEIYKYCDDQSAFPSEKLFACEASFLSADLMMKLLKAHPAQRLTSSLALKHQWLPSDATSLKGSERSRASTDSERSMVLEDTPHPVVSRKGKGAAIALVSSSSEQEVSTGGYDTATNPALKSFVTPVTTTDKSRHPHGKTPINLPSPLSGPMSNEPVPLSKPEEDQNGFQAVERQYFSGSKSRVSLTTPSREPSPFVNELDQQMRRTSTDQLTPTTIPPEHVLLESDGDANIHLFSSQNSRSQSAQFPQKPTGRKGRSELDDSASQTPLSIEYIKVKDRNEGDSPRPSVRARITPSSKNRTESSANDIQTTERKGTGKLSYTKQIQLSSDVNAEKSPEDEGEGEPGYGREDESLPLSSLTHNELPERKESTSRGIVRRMSTRRHAVQQESIPLRSPSGDLPEDGIVAGSKVARDFTRTETPQILHTPTDDPEAPRLGSVNAGNGPPSRSVVNFPEKTPSGTTPVYLERFSEPPGNPARVPEGWEAKWNDKYKEWFYTNIYTKRSQWEEPTKPIYPHYDNDDDDDDDDVDTVVIDGDQNNMASFRVGATSRAKSLGHARWESIQARPARREAEWLVKLRKKLKM